MRWTWLLLCAWFAGACGRTAPLEAPLPAGMPSQNAPLPSVSAGSGWTWDNPRPFGYELHGAWSFGPSDVWLVGDGVIARFDGRAWSTSEPPVKLLDAV